MTQAWPGYEVDPESVRTEERLAPSSDEIDETDAPVCSVAFHKNLARTPTCLAARHRHFSPPSLTRVVEVAMLRARRPQRECEVYAGAGGVSRGCFYLFS